jgi:hypothetical protein
MSTMTATRPWMITRAVQADAIEVSPKRRTIRAIVNDDSIDRYDTVLSPSGIDVKPYLNEGGPILFEHGNSRERGRQIVGNTIELGPDRFKGRAVTVGLMRFIQDEADPFVDWLWRRYAAKEMKSWSINLKAFDFTEPTMEECRTRPDLVNCKGLCRRSELLELSAVSVGGNSNASHTLEVGRALGDHGGRPTGARPLDPRGQRLYDEIMEDIRPMLALLAYGPTPKEAREAEAWAQHRAAVKGLEGRRR